MRKKLNRLSFGIVSLLLLVSVMVAAGGTALAQKEKLTAEEVLARHLKSIGTPEDIAATKTRIIAGTSVFTARSPGVGQNSGLSILFSEGNKSVVAMTFANPSYPHDKFGYDGNNMFISYAKPGIRSTLGDFIYHRTGIFKDGLIGGTLSTAWPLLNFDKERGKLEYSGTKKVEGRDAHVLKYYPRRGSELKISLFFDSETFRHVKTQYTQSVVPQMAASPDADKQGQRELHNELEELFSDFKQEGKLTLPHTYKIKLLMERSNGAAFIAEWEMVLSKFSYNQALETGWFDVNAAPAN